MIQFWCIKEHYMVVKQYNQFALLMEIQQKTEYLRWRIFDSSQRKRDVARRCLVDGNYEYGHWLNRKTDWGWRRLFSTNYNKYLCNTTSPCKASRILGPKIYLLIQESKCPDKYLVPGRTRSCRRAKRQETQQRYDYNILCWRLLIQKLREGMKCLFFWIPDTISLTAENRVNPLSQVRAVSVNMMHIIYGDENQSRIQITLFNGKQQCIHYSQCTWIGLHGHTSAIWAQPLPYQMGLNQEQSIWLEPQQFQVAPKHLDQSPHSQQKDFWSINGAASGRVETIIYQIIQEYSESRDREYGKLEDKTNNLRFRWIVCVLSKCV